MNRDSRHRSRPVLDRLDARVLMAADPIAVPAPAAIQVAAPAEVVDVSTHSFRPGTRGNQVFN